MDKKIDRLMKRWKNGWMGGRMKRQMDGLVGGKTDR